MGTRHHGDGHTADRIGSSQPSVSISCLGHTTPLMIERSSSLPEAHILILIIQVFKFILSSLLAPYRICQGSRVKSNLNIVSQSKHLSRSCPSPLALAHNGTRSQKGFVPPPANVRRYLGFWISDVYSQVWPPSKTQWKRGNKGVVSLWAIASCIGLTLAKYLLTGWEDATDVQYVVLSVKFNLVWPTDCRQEPHCESNRSGPAHFALQSRFEMQGPRS